MKKLLLALALVSLPAHALEFKSTTPVQGRGSAGETYAAETELYLGLQDCSKLVATWRELWRDPIEAEGLFQDASAFCMPWGDEALFAATQVVEAFDAGQLPRLRALMKELSELEAYGIRMDFKKVNVLFDIRDLQIEAPGQTHESQALWRKTWEERIPSAMDYTQRIEKENQYYWSAGRDEWLTYVAHELEFTEFENYKSRLQSDAQPHSRHQYGFIFEDGSRVRSSSRIGNFRMCTREETPCL
jgi:hypothetical protein